MYVLDKLWQGKISPSERAVMADSEYHKLMRKLIEKDKLITAELSPEGKQHFKDYEEIQNAMIGISEQDIFTTAFRMGMGLILDVMGEYDSQFSPYREG